MEKKLIEKNNIPFTSFEKFTLKTRQNLSCENEFYLHENKNHFSCQSLRIFIRFCETAHLPLP